MTQLVEADTGTVVSVCIPARDEATTVAGVVGIAASLRAVGIVDEIMVVDDGSTDATCLRAASAGAHVLANPAGTGKGQALRHAVSNTRGDVLLFLDADVVNYSIPFLQAMLAPLADPRVQMVKPAYGRPLNGRAGEGGRVTELLARPLLERFYPELVGIGQPLAGETAIRRAALEGIAIAEGYGVEMALLIDIYVAHGLDAIAQVELGERVHRNRPLDQLRPHARAVLDAVLARTSLATTRSQR
jgi:glucosyl-3-phosphoglycerate synthase